MLKFKRAQISETMTWIVATIIIIVSLTFFVFLADVLAQEGAIKNFADKTTSGVSFELDKEVKAKTNMAFELNSLNKEKINNWISKNEK